MHPVLRLDAIRFAYREASVFAGFDLAIEGGGMTAILGPNGTGRPR
jgi:ABC-type Mn2+/Zn2+ transport system ATPase subunit